MDELIKRALGAGLAVVLLWILARVVTVSAARGWFNEKERRERRNKRGGCAVTKFMALMATWLLIWGLGVAVMIYGWGLVPTSWPWIICGGIGGQLFLAIIQALVKEGK